MRGFVENECSRSTVRVEWRLPSHRGDLAHPVDAVNTTVDNDDVEGVGFL